MKNAFAGIIIFLLFVAGSDAVYIVKQTERAILLRFGQIVEADIAPGLHFKMPWVDVEKYYTSSSGEESRTSNLLQQRINDGLRNKFGERDLQEVVSGQRDLLMEELTRELNLSTAEEYGIEVIDVRVKQIELPLDVRASVYERMTSERQREAQQLRSRGNELAIGIEADADRQEAVLLVEAYRDSETIRGEGDAQAAATYASAYSKNEEFYAFTRSINSYQESFSNKGDILLVDPDSEYFKYLRASEVQ